MIAAGLVRWLRHLWVGPMHVARAFPRDAMVRIEAAIAAGEQRHRAELRFALESSLPTSALWRGLSPRERALEVFGLFRVWDTDENNGVLVYLLWADHAVEIVADRGAVRALDAAVWQAAAARFAQGCRDGRAAEGALECLATIEEALVAGFPADGRANPDELPNAPIVLR